MRLDRRWAVLRVQALVPLVGFSLRLIGLQRTWRILAHTVAFQDPPSNAEREIEKTEAILQEALQYTPLDGDCLSRSLVLWWLLARGGIESELRIGVHKRGGFNAHAWVEVEGKALGEGREVYHRYQVIKQFSLGQAGKSK